MTDSFGKKVKRLRKYKKLTQEKLAELINIDVRQVARIEACESLPSIPTLLKLCEVFSVTPNDMLIFTQEKTSDYTPKHEVYDILSLAKPEQMELIKKLILAVL